MTEARTRYTYQDFLSFPNDGNRHEIIGGEWIMTPAPEVPHQRILRKLSNLLDAHVNSAGLGEVLFAPTDVVLSDEDVVEPDLLFVSRSRASIITRKNLQGAPDLVVEVVSPSTSVIDRGSKLELYRRHGVREYWIIDPDARTVEVHEFAPRPRTRIYQSGQSFSSELLPGLSIALDLLF